MNKEFPDDDHHKKDDDDDDQEKDDDGDGPGVSERGVPRALQRGSSLGRGVRAPVVWRRLCLAGGWTIDNRDSDRLLASYNIHSDHLLTIHNRGSDRFLRHRLDLDSDWQRL